VSTDSSNCPSASSKVVVAARAGKGTERTIPNPNTKTIVKNFNTNYTK
jgi:hypothetical protein